MIYTMDCPQILMMSIGERPTKDYFGWRIGCPKKTANSMIGFFHINGYDYMVFRHSSTKFARRSSIFHQSTLAILATATSAYSWSARLAIAPFDFIRITLIFSTAFLCSDAVLESMKNLTAVSISANSTLYCCFSSWFHVVFILFSSESMVLFEEKNESTPTNADARNPIEATIISSVTHIFIFLFMHPRQTAGCFFGQCDDIRCLTKIPLTFR
ncbi:MAG: hypothetical protein [Caudoviricetes sp.]|nr:MAG: hypothetical protein [Caudoviricetes sp.]